MKILVIGNGLIGSAVAEHLQSNCNEVKVFSRSKKEKLKCEQIIGNIFDFEDFSRGLSWKPEILINTAWITTPGIYKNAKTNHEFANFAIKLAKEAFKYNWEHVIFLGSCAEYTYKSTTLEKGHISSPTENLYVLEKIRALNYIKGLDSHFAPRLTWARVFNPYGPGQDHRRLIPSLIRSLKDRTPISLHDSTSSYDWISTRDIASAISWIISNQLPMEVDIGTSNGHTNLEILSILEKKIGVKNTASWHKAGMNEHLVMNRNSPLLNSGWIYADDLDAGLDWMLESCES